MDFNYISQAVTSEVQGNKNSLKHWYIYFVHGNYFVQMVEYELGAAAAPPQTPGLK